MRPSLFIIGAMKAGTTSLHRYLARHPEVFMCEPKEPGYFVKELTWSRGEAWYLDLFREAGDARVVGESSTHYAKRPIYDGVARRIHAFNPAGRLIYLMRDPVERAISHFWHNTHNVAFEAERRDMATAFRRDPQYVAYSDYAMQLGPYLDLFGPDAVHCVVFEDLAAKPAETLGAVSRWLGVADIPGTGAGRVWNARPADGLRARGLGILNRLRHTRLWGGLAPVVPKKLRAWGKSMAQEKAVRRDVRLEEALAYVRPILQERTDHLRVLLAREFPEWRVLAGADPGSPAVATSVEEEA